jgi:gas vesicle protein
MRAVGAEVLEVVFAGAVLVLFGSAAAVVAGRLSRATLLALGGFVSAAALAAWVVVALDPGREQAVAAAGITVCAAAQLGLVVLRRLVQQGRDVDASLTAARDELDALVRRETENRAAELERTLTLARAQSLSRLVEEERRMAEERRAAVHELERQTNAELSETLAKIQARIGARLGEWTADLQRTDQELSAQIASLRQRQEQLLAESAARLGLETERLETVSEEQHERLAALAAQFERVARETAESAHSAIDTHESERRRALQEVAERLRERERELRERIAAEEAEAIQRIQAGFADVERRQIDQLKRIVERTSSSFSEALSRQFGEEIKRGREDAAQRLSRELERAVEHFSREAQSVLAERLAHVADAGGQRLERKLSQIGTSLEQEQGELTAELQRRIRAAEVELRSQVQELAADAEAERTVLAARLNELQRRVDALLGQAEARTATFRSG